MNPVAVPGTGTARSAAASAGRELTVGQEALWFVQSMDPDSCAYNVTSAFVMYFTVDVPLLESAIEATVRAHDVLNSVFRCDASGRVRRYPGDAAGAFPALEIHEFPGPAADADGLRAFTLDLARRPFQLERELPLRLMMVRSADSPDILVSCAHHIVADNVSQILICQEILSRYAALVDGRGYRGPDPGTAAGFDDFVRQESEYRTSRRAEKATEYWRRELRRGPEHPALPTDLPRPDFYRFEGSELVLDLPPELLARIDKTAAEQNVTTFAYLMTVYQTLLYGFGGQTDFLIGYPVTQRQGENFRASIGHFVNTLPMCTHLDPEDSFDAVLRATALKLWRNLMHRDHPFALLAGLAELPRDPSRPGLVRASFVLNEPARADPIADGLRPGHRVESDGLSASEYYLPQQQGQFEVVLQITRHSTSAQATWKYNTSLFTEHTVRRLADGYCELLERAVEGTLPATLRELHDRIAASAPDTSVRAALAQAQGL